MLLLPPALLHQINRHAEQTYPEECCGILLGRILSRQQVDPQKILLQVLPTRNAWSEAPELQELLNPPPSRYSASQRRDRYWIEPADLLQAQKTARAQNQQVIGIYHSHPDHSAIPSEFDRQLAWITYAYLIVSVQQGKAEDARCWQLNSISQFEPETVRVEI